ncbi:MAG: DNA polymerase III subunit epsilon [Gammaproteobacteria bacterium]
MRQIVLDTETTGLEPDEGHRIIEIGCIELQNRRRTQNVFHRFLNPEREIDEGAMSVHGITREQLDDCPRFVDIAQDFISFVRDAEVIIHNAPFDVGFIDAELKRLGKAWGRMADHCRIIDTLAMARQMHPGQRNNLDALCTRYSVDNSARTLHGALLDAEILSDVYLRMTGGQASLLLDEEPKPSGVAVRAKKAGSTTDAINSLRVVTANQDELARHEQRLATIDAKSAGKCVWLKLRAQRDSK